MRSSLRRWLLIGLPASVLFAVLAAGIALWVVYNNVEPVTDKEIKDLYKAANVTLDFKSREQSLGSTRLGAPSLQFGFPHGTVQTTTPELLLSMDWRSLVTRRRLEFTGAQLLAPRIEMTVSDEKPNAAESNEERQLRLWKLSGPDTPWPAVRVAHVRLVQGEFKLQQPPATKPFVSLEGFSLSADAPRFVAAAPTFLEAIVARGTITADEIAIEDIRLTGMKADFDMAGGTLWLTHVVGRCAGRDVTLKMIGLDLTETRVGAETSKDDDPVIQRCRTPSATASLTAPATAIDFAASTARAVTMDARRP